MKNLMFTLMLGITMMFSANAQNDVVNQVFESLKTMDTATLAEYLQDDIVLEVMEEEDLLSKSEALEKVQSFLNEKNAKGVSLKHRGDSGNGTVFAIGSLETEGGTLRIYFVVEDGKVSELCFQENE